MANEPTGFDDVHVAGDLTVVGTLTADNITPSAGGVGTANLADGAVTPAKMSAPYAIETLHFPYASGNQTTGNRKAALVIGVAGTIVDVRAKLATAPVGSAFQVDVNKNGTTIFSTNGNRPIFADGSPTSSTTAPDVTALAAGDILDYDIDQIGSGTAGAGLMVSVTIKRTVVA